MPRPSLAAATTLACCAVLDSHGAVCAQPLSTAATIESATSEPGPPPIKSETDWLLGTGIASCLFGVGFFVVSVWAAVRVGDIGRDEGYQAYARGVPADANVCDTADSGVLVAGAPSPAQISEMCGTAGTFEAVQAFAIPLNIVLGVVGITLISQSETVKGPTKAARATPLVAAGPTGGFVGVTVPF